MNNKTDHATNNQKTNATEEINFVEFEIDETVEGLMERC